LTIKLPQTEYTQKSCDFQISSRKIIFKALFFRSCIQLSAVEYRWLSHFSCTSSML